jgi:hypothetical protein
MGKCETAKASIGIKILVSDLISQLNEDNFELIRNMIEDEDTYIEDENDYFNEAFYNVKYDYLPDTYLEFKEYLTKQLKTKGSYHKSRNGEFIPTLDNGCLWDQYLLVPIKEILQTERWGHDRYGSNGKSRPLDFDLSMHLDEYKDIQKTSTVFLLSNHSG